MVSPVWMEKGHELSSSPVAALRVADGSLGAGSAAAGVSLAASVRAVGSEPGGLWVCGRSPSGGAVAGSGSVGSFSLAVESGVSPGGFFTAVLLLRLPAPPVLFFSFLPSFLSSSSSSSFSSSSLSPSSPPPFPFFPSSPLSLAAVVVAAALASLFASVGPAV